MHGISVRFYEMGDSRTTYLTFLCVSKYPSPQKREKNRAFIVVGPINKNPRIYDINKSMKNIPQNLFVQNWENQKYFHCKMLKQINFSGYLYQSRFLSTWLRIVFASFLTNSTLPLFPDFCIKHSILLLDLKKNI